MQSCLYFSVLHWETTWGFSFLCCSSPWTPAACALNFLLGSVLSVYHPDTVGFKSSSSLPWTTTTDFQFMLSFPLHQAVTLPVPGQSLQSKNMTIAQTCLKSQWLLIAFRIKSKLFSFTFTRFGPSLTFPSQQLLHSLPHALCATSRKQVLL